VEPRAELARRIARRVTEDGALEVAPGLRFFRASGPAGPVYALSRPCFCIIAQGSKEVALGRDRYRYGGAQYLLISAGLPLVGHVVEASPERPYLAMALALDPAVVTAVLVESGHLASRTNGDARALAVSELDADLLDAAVRIVRLLDAPADYGVLAPLVIREIVYRLLIGDQGDRLRQIAVIDGRVHRITKAIELLGKDRDKPLRIADIARQLGMSVSGLHSQFKAVTAMSPLQFQKQLRLQEARRLLLAGEVDVARAGYRVGYDDPSHFSREYKRLFGEPPMRDVERLQELASNS
jgi:AraC-like DNA-binding protein